MQVGWNTKSELDCTCVWVYVKEIESSKLDRSSSMNSILITLALISFSPEFQASEQSVSSTPNTQQKVAGTCFKSGEQRSGMNKICYYNCIGGTVAINVSSTQLCPLTIRNWLFTDLITLLKSDHPCRAVRLLCSCIASLGARTGYCLIPHSSAI